MEIDKIASHVTLGSSIEHYSSSHSDLLKDVIENETIKMKVMREINRRLQVNQPPGKADMRRPSQISNISIEKKASFAECESMAIPEGADLLIGVTPLTLYHIVLITVIIEEAIECLQLLGAIHPVDNVRAVVNYKPLSKRYTYENQDASTRAIEEDIYKDSTDFTLQTYYRLQETRLFVQLILDESRKDILVNSSLNSLTKRIKTYIKHRKDENDLLKEVAYNKLVIPKLREVLEKDEIKFTDEIQKCSQFIGILKDAMEDEIYMCILKEDYITKWENSRYEQNKILNDRLEKKETDTIKQYEIKTQEESRIHYETIKFLTINIKEMEEQTIYWQKEYEEECEKLTIKLQILSAQRDQVIEQAEELRKQFEKKHKEIENYLEYKEERKRQQMILDEKNRCAMRIQSWWRMLMVRKGLGPYRKKKPKGKNKGGKGKK